MAVILDDNMYYRRYAILNPRHAIQSVNDTAQPLDGLSYNSIPQQTNSMRREAYKLAAAHGAGYACLWVDAPLEAALARNADRPAGERVEETTVRRMAERLEPPDPTVHSWEGRFMVRVDAAAEAEPASVKAEVLACVEEAWRAPGMRLIDRVVLLLFAQLKTRGFDVDCSISCVHIHSCTATIPRAEALSPEELEAARRKTRDSTLHATDLALRKVRSSQAS